MEYFTSLQACQKSQLLYIVVGTWALSSSLFLTFSLLCAAGDGAISASCGLEVNWSTDSSQMHGNPIENLSFVDINKTTPTNYLPMQNCSALPWTMNEPAHNCPRCGKSYQHKGSLSRHLRVECGNRRSETCSVCLKSFLYKHHLERHMKFVHNI